MKTTFCFILTLFALVTLAFVSNSFSQKTSPEYIVRVVYFHPNDLQPQSNIDTVLDTLMKRVQQFYADEMERHGFGRKTFRLETDAAGNLIIHSVIEGKFPNMHYNADGYDEDAVFTEIYEQYERPSDNIMYLYWMDRYDPVLHNSQVGGGGLGNSFGGTVHIVATNFERAPGHVYIRAWTVIAHELGHAFGLPHDFRDDRYIMSYGDSALQDQLSYCAAEWLNAHRYFNTSHNSFDSHNSFEKVPMIRMLEMSFVSPPNTIRLRFEITHSERLHQAQLLTNSFSRSGNPSFDPTALLDCKSLNTNRATIEFITTELAPASEYVDLTVIDVHGNFTNFGEKLPIDVASLLPDSKPVSIPDANLAAVIRETLGLVPGSTITQLDMLGLGKLEASKKQITDLTGLEHATNLERVDLRDNQISNITVFAKLTQLRQLRIERNKVSDISPLARLTQLSSFWASRNHISDLSPLTGLTNLTFLRLMRTNISDITPLAGLTNLRTLVLGDNHISDLSPLIGLADLGSLTLWNNQISDVSPLTGLTNLGLLYLGGNPIKNQKPLRVLLRKNPNLKIYLTNYVKPLTLRVLADLNGDGVVNIQDVVLVAASFGKAGGNPADLNDDGVVNVQDLVLIANVFGNAPSAP